MSLATIRSSTLQLSSAQNILEDDEAVLDSALDNGLFHCLPHCLITKKTLTGEEFYLRRIHQLITDLIVLMPLKVRPTFIVPDGYTTIVYITTNANLGGSKLSPIRVILEMGVYCLPWH